MPVQTCAAFSGCVGDNTLKSGPGSYLRAIVVGVLGSALQGMVSLEFVLEGERLQFIRGLRGLTCL